MTDLDLKNKCMEDAEIDLTRYSNNELTQIREAMRMYAERKLKLFAMPDVSQRSELFFKFIDEHYSHSSENYKQELKDCFAEYFKKNVANGLAMSRCVINKLK